MNVLFILWKIFCAGTAAGSGLLLYYRDWKIDSKRNRKRYERLTCWLWWLIIIVAASGICGIGIDPYFQRKIADEELADAKPFPELRIYESTDSSIILEISSPLTNKQPMHNLSLSFDIPGKNAKCRITHATRAENCFITNFFKLGVGLRETVSERVDVSCNSIMPSGFVRAQVDFERTRRRHLPGSVDMGITNMFYVPVMDLRAHTPCLYTWSYDGRELLEKCVLTLTNLACVAEDSENTRRTFRGDDWSNAPIEIRTYLTNIFTPEYFNRIDEARKNW